MAKSTLFIKELEDVLHHWEDVNIYSEAFFQKSLKGNPVTIDGYRKPLIGSEVDDDRFLRRSIKNFQGLRSSVENHVNVDYNQFLPRVPTHDIEEYSKINFLRSGIRTISSFPYFLLEWSNYKKVFCVENQDMIPVILPEEKNYFRFLPYGSFIIKFNKPILIKTTQGGESSELSYSLIMVVLNEKQDILDVMFIDSEVGSRFLMSEEERQLFKKVALQPNFQPKGTFNFHVQYGAHFPGISIDVDSGEMVSGISFVQNSEYGIVEQIDTYDFVNPDHIEMGKYYKGLMGIVNGFCKLISELPPRTVSVSEETSKPSDVKHPDYPWHSVPITQMRDLGNSENPGAFILTGNGTGGEKCYHWRASHWRRIKQKDGSVQRIWIETMEIRDDKKEEENLAGSATIIKDGKNR